MPQTINIRAGDTDELDLDVSATGLTTLSGATILIYFKKDGAAANHVNGVACTVVSGLQIRFDPVSAKNGGGNAFDSAGIYRGHVKITHGDGDVTRHPGDATEDVIVNVGTKLG